MATTPALPRGRVAWGVYALLVVIFMVSSAAPFLRLGSGVPQLSGGDLLATTVYLASWVPFLALAAWLLRRSTGRLAWSIHLALALAIPSLHSLAFMLITGAARGEPRTIAALLQAPAFLVLTLLGTLQYLVLLAVGIAVAAGRAADSDRALAAALELERSRLSERLATARLDALTSQLRPHFLFNTMNSISVLTTTDPQAAQAMVGQLSVLLRTVLMADDRPTVPLAAELEVLEAYLAIQRVRFGERLDVRLEIEPGANDCAVPVMLLQPLVENAIEHAVAHRQSGGTIAVSAVRRSDRATIRVSDNGPGAAHKPASGNGSHAGIGLGNTRERLQQLYGSEHRFSVDYGSGGCTVTIELPFRSSLDVR